MLNILAVGAGGFIGAICRYLIGLIHISESFVFPIKTFCINIIGCIAIGIIAVSISKNMEVSPQMLLFFAADLQHSLHLL